MALRLLRLPSSSKAIQALSGATDHDVDVHVVHTDEQVWAHGAACQSLAQLFQVSRSRPPNGEGT
jgi:hypothetical protein